jgi:hypothetical protein
MDDLEKEGKMETTKWRAMRSATQSTVTGS